MIVHMRIPRVNHERPPMHDAHEELCLDFELHPPMALPEQVGEAPTEYVDATHGTCNQNDAHRRPVWRLYLDTLQTRQAPQRGVRLLHVHASVWLLEG